jgi:hypothetical protein
LRRSRARDIFLHCPKRRVTSLLVYTSKKY